jgi:hypothetical protein
MGREVEMATFQASGEIMAKSEKDSTTLLDGTEPKGPSPMPATAKLAEPRPPESTKAWLKRGLETMDRMSKDETFRQEIAKKIF